MAALTVAMRRIVEGRRHAVLATQNADGTMHLTPVWYLFADGNFHVETLSSDRKARNVAARPRATIIVDARQPGGECWAYAAGAAELLSGTESRAINAQIARRYLTDEALGASGVGRAFADAVDATIRVTPETWRSWSLRDLDEQFFGGILASTPEKWFRPLER